MQMLYCRGQGSCHSKAKFHAHAHTVGSYFPQGSETPPSEMQEGFNLLKFTHQSNDTHVYYYRVCFLVYNYDLATF